jgi:hypothetical protein
MVLGTADRDGRPWASPVYYAPAAYRDFFWVSRPGSRHSCNIETRPEVGIVVFDSSVRIGTGQGVYMSAVAREVEGDERAEGIEIFSRRSLTHGGREWTVADVDAPGGLRLYRATAAEQYCLNRDDRRVLVDLSS